MRHVTIDLYNCCQELLENEAHLRQFLEALPDHIHMQRVGPVELRYIHTSNPLDDGYSGFVIIATSHCSLHAWGPYRMVNIDVFSCEEFDPTTVLDFACRAFKTRDAELQAIERATRSPRQLLRSR